MIDKLLDVLGVTWVGAMISLIALIVGVALSIWGVRKSNKRAVPVATLKTRRLVGGTSQALPDNVEVLFDGEKVPQIARTLVHFWNAGDATLNSGDIVSKDPLKLVYGTNTRVLSVSVLRTTRKAVNFMAVADPAHPRNVQLSFDFLDSRDGALIEILHTGSGSPRITGTIKGVPQGVWLPLGTKHIRRVTKILLGLKIVWMVGILIAAVLGFLSRHFPALKPWSAPVMMSASGLLFCTLAFEIWQKRPRHPKALHEVANEQTLD